MDHSSSLPVIAKLAKNAKIIASVRGKDELIKHYGADFERVETVKTGDEHKTWKENPYVSLRHRCFIGQTACSPTLLKTKS